MIAVRMRTEDTFHNHWSKGQRTVTPPSKGQVGFINSERRLSLKCHLAK